MIDFKPDQENSDSSIRSNFDSFLNHIDSSDLHTLKHESQTISTDDGMIIDFKPDSENADSSIRINCDSFSNRTDSSDLQLLKQNIPKISIERGIIICLQVPKYRTTDRHNISSRDP
jgi:hypothetical protein